MKKFLYVIMACILLLLCFSCSNGKVQWDFEATLGPVSEESRVDLQNRFSKKTISQEDLHILYESEKELIERLADRFWLAGENLRGVSRASEEIEFEDGHGNLVSVPEAFREEVREYYDIVGLKQEGYISTRELFGEHKVVEFFFSLPKPKYTEAGIIYSPEYINSEWIHLEGDWYLFYYRR